MLSTPEVRHAFGITTGVTERNILINITKKNSLRSLPNILMILMIQITI